MIKIFSGRRLILEVLKVIKGFYFIKLNCPCCNQDFFITEKAIVPIWRYSGYIIDFDVKCPHCKVVKSIPNNNLIPYELRQQLSECAETAHAEAEKIYNQALENGTNEEKAYRLSMITYRQIVKDFSFISEEEFHKKYKKTDSSNSNSNIINFYEFQKQD